MWEKIQIFFTKVGAFFDQHPAAFLAFGFVLLVVGVIVNSVRDRDSVLNVWMILGIVMLLVGMFKMTGVSFMSF